MTIDEYKEKIISIIKDMEKEYGTDLKDCDIYTDVDTSIEGWGSKVYHITFKF